MGGGSVGRQSHRVPFCPKSRPSQSRRHRDQRSFAGTARVDRILPTRQACRSGYATAPATARPDRSQSPARRETIGDRPRNGSRRPRLRLPLRNATDAPLMLFRGWWKDALLGNASIRCHSEGPGSHRPARTVPALVARPPGRWTIRGRAGGGLRVRGQSVIFSATRATALVLTVRSNTSSKRGDPTGLFS